MHCIITVIFIVLVITVVAIVIVAVVAIIIIAAVVIVIAITTTIEVVGSGFVLIVKVVEIRLVVAESKDFLFI
jgi:hypothetical protein